MKISSDEIDAARIAYAEAANPSSVVGYGHMKAAIEAALRVRKARKKAKREKAIDLAEMAKTHAEWDKQASDDALTTPKPLTIEAGKSYRTRDGRKADVFTVESESAYPVRGSVSGMSFGWSRRGGYYHDVKASHDLDLIAEWQE